MPELPEVETIRLVLQRRIVGLTVKNIEVRSAKSFIGKSSQVIGKKVVGVWRRAKMLGVELVLSLRGVKRRGNLSSSQDSHGLTSSDLGMTLLIHLKMTGQLIYIPNHERSTINDKRFIGGHPTEDMVGSMPNPHTRVIFTFSDGSKLYFNDQRRFGWVKVTPSVILSEAKDLSKLGPEPLEKGFTWQVLKQNLLKHKSMPIKVAIMDQSVVSGVGNIYSNEACFNARLDPRTKISNLIDLQFKKLHQGILKALKEGIAHGGSTRAHFRDPEGHKGYFLDYAYVYGLDKHPCKICKTEIKKISLAGRGTYFCPACQK